MSFRDQINDSIASAVNSYRRRKQFQAAVEQIETRCYLAKAPNGIPGNTGSTLGKASDVQLYEVDLSDNITPISGAVVDGWNLATSAVGADVWLILLEENVTGRLIVIWEECAQVIGYGSMWQASPGAAFPDITGVYQTLDTYDTLGPGPVNATLSLANGTFSADVPGIWLFNFALAFEHNSSNQGRITNIRLWDVTAGVSLGTSVVGTGRNAEATNFSTGFSEVIDANVGNTLRLEIGGGDTYTSVDMDSLAVDLTLITPL